MVHMIVSGFQYLCFSLWISRPVALSLSRSLDSDSLVIYLSLSLTLVLYESTNS